MNHVAFGEIREGPPKSAVTAIVALSAMLLYMLAWGLLTRRWSTEARAARKRATAIHPMLSVPVPWVFILTYLMGLGLQVLAPLTMPGPAVGPIRWIGLLLLGLGLLLAASALVLFK